MKRLLLAAAAALALLCAESAEAQILIRKNSDYEAERAAERAADSLCTLPCCDSAGFGRRERQPLVVESARRDSLGIDTLRRLDTVDSDLLCLRGSDDGRMLLEVGGFGLTLGRSYEQRAWDDLKRARFWAKAVCDFEFGFTQLTGADYGGYAPGERGFLDQRLGPSFHFSFLAVGVGGRLNRKGTLSWSTGLEYALDNIRLTDNAITLHSEGGRVAPVALDTPAAKSKIVYSSLGIPLRVSWCPVKHMTLSAVIHNDFLLGGDAIHKHPKRKHGLSGFGVYRFGIGASISYRPIGVFVRYSPSPLFKAGAGPECGTLSFGFAWNFTL